MTSTSTAPITNDVQIARVTTARSPSFCAFYNHHPVSVTCDSGATASMIKQSCAIKAQMPIKHTSHTANQADGKSQLNAVEEVHVTLTRGSLKLQLEAIVVKDLDSDLLAGTCLL